MTLLLNFPSRIELYPGKYANNSIAKFGLGCVFSAETQQS